MHSKSNLTTCNPKERRGAAHETRRVHKCITTGYVPQHPGKHLHSNQGLYTHSDSDWLSAHTTGKRCSPMPYYIKATCHDPSQCQASYQGPHVLSPASQFKSGWPYKVQAQCHHADKEIKTNTHTHIHWHARTHTHTLARTHTHTHTHIHWHARTRTHTYTHTCIHTYAYTHTHTHTHTHT